MDELVFINSQMLHAKTKLWREFWYYRLTDHQDEMGNYTVCKLAPDSIRSEMSNWLNKKAKMRGTKYKYCMFTINFKEEIDIEYIKKKLKKCLTKNWIEQYIYCYEWRDIDKGMHVHLKTWIKEGKVVYNCKKEVYNTFKDLVGNKLHVNVRYSNRNDCFNEYIKGYKLGQVKPTHIHDCVMRNRLKLEAYYEGPTI